MRTYSCITTRLGFYRALYVVLIKCLYNSKIVENTNKGLRCLSKRKKEIPDLCIPIKNDLYAVLLAKI